MTSAKKAENPVFEKLDDGILCVLPDQANVVVFAFHGCSHSADDWFFLPEEKKIVKASLSRGFGFVSISSSDRDSGCWNAEDMFLVEKAIGLVKKKLGGRNYELVVVGASSGGSFASFLLSKFFLKGM